MKYLELDKFDEKTGEITVTFENLGPLCYDKGYPG